MKYKVNLLLVLCLLSLVAVGLSACAARPAVQTEYGVFIGEDAEALKALSDYETLVIDAAYFSRRDVERLHENGVRVYSYLNIGSIETFREAYPRLKQYTLGPYENWPDEYWVDVSHDAWQSYIAQQAQALVEKDIDGFFLDNLDVYDRYPRQDIFRALVSMVNILEAYDKDIVINGGDVFVTEAVLNRQTPLVQLTAVNQECVFTALDFDRDTTEAQDAETSAYYQDYLQACGEKGLEVYLLEYAQETDSALIAQVDAYCRENAFTYYLAQSKELTLAEPAQ